MKHPILSLFLILNACVVNAQTMDTATKVIWGFPITSYIVPLEKTGDIVQVLLPSNIKLVQGKQIGVLRGIAKSDDIDTASKGWGKCHLIKGDYNYFAITHSGAGKAKEGDLVYTFLPRKTFDYLSPVFYCASNGVTFLTVTDTPFYRPADFLQKRSQLTDNALMGRMVEDIRYTGKYILAEHPEMNQTLKDGGYKDKKMLELMMSIEQKDLIAFLRYVGARPRRYAGNSWKISETFATWLVAGAPTVKEN